MINFCIRSLKFRSVIVEHPRPSNNTSWKVEHLKGNSRGGMYSWDIWFQVTPVCGQTRPLPTEKCIILTRATRLHPVIVLDNSIPLNCFKFVNLGDLYEIANYANTSDGSSLYCRGFNFNSFILLVHYNLCIVLFIGTMFLFIFVSNRSGALLLFYFHFNDFVDIIGMVENPGKVSTFRTMQGQMSFHSFTMTNVIFSFTVKVWEDH